MLPLTLLAAAFSTDALASGAVFRGRELREGADGKLAIIQIDPFGLDTEETAPPADLPDAEIIRRAIALLPSLGCIGEQAARELSGSAKSIRFGPVDVYGADGEKARGQVAPPAPGSEHATIIIDESKPYLRDPLNAARVIAHEFVHDLQYRAGLMQFVDGRVASRFDLHAPAAAERVLPNGCRVSDAAKARDLLADINEALARGDEPGLKSAQAKIEQVISDGLLPAYRSCLEARLAVLQIETGDDDSKEAVAALKKAHAQAPASQCEANVQAYALALEGDHYYRMEWEDHALKTYADSLRYAVDPDLIAYVHQEIAEVHHSLEGEKATEFWPHIKLALDAAARPDLRAKILLHAGSYEVRYGSPAKALAYLKEAEAACGSHCDANVRDAIEDLRRHWTPDK